MLRSIAFLAALACLLSWGSAAIAEDDHSSGKYQVPNLPDVLDLTAETPASELPGWMKLGVNSEIWLPPLIESLEKQRPGRKVTVVALIQGPEGERYLVTRWVQHEWLVEYVDFHKVLVTREGRPYLKFLRRVNGQRDYEYAKIVKPTGRFSRISSAPVIVIELCSCGSDYRGHRLRLIEMRRNTVDITPDRIERVTDIVDLDGDGRSEIAAMDDRWAGMYDTRGAAGPRLPVILSAADRLRPACRDHAEALRRALNWNNKLAREDKYDCTRAESVAANLLIHAQLGEFDAALGKLDELNALLDPAGERCFTTAAESAAIFKEVIESARQSAAHDPSAQCLVSISDFRGGHAGAEARTKHMEDLATHE
jgi:hypothetical protein